MSQLKLFGYWRSSASWRVRWALHIKNIEFEYLPVNLRTGEQNQPSFSSLNPMKSLPFLQISDSESLGQSLAILQWIEAQQPNPPLFPQSPFLKAKCLELCEIINSDTAPLQIPRIQKRHSDSPTEQLNWTQEHIRRGLHGFNEISASYRGKYSFGDNVSASDLFLCPQIYNALRYEISVGNEFPYLFEIYQRCLETESGSFSRPENQLDSIGSN